MLLYTGNAGLGMLLCTGNAALGWECRFVMGMLLCTGNAGLGILVCTGNAALVWECAATTTTTEEIFCFPALCCRKGSVGAVPLPAPWDVFMSLIKPCLSSRNKYLNLNLIFLISTIPWQAPVSCFVLCPVPNPAEKTGRLEISAGTQTPKHHLRLPLALLPTS